MKKKILSFAKVMDTSTLRRVNCAAFSSLKSAVQEAQASERRLSERAVAGHSYPLLSRTSIIILTCLVVIACGCGGGGSGGSGERAADEPQHTDLDEILSVPNESLKVEDGTHLPSVLNGTFILVQIRTMSQTGQVLSDDAIDPSATITITAGFADPVDTFSATSNLISKDAISVTGLVSLNVTSERLIVKISESNTGSIVPGETYSLELGQTGATGFGISIEGTIGGAPVEQIYMFNKSY